MAEPYKDRIEEYCKAQGVEIPMGFHRHAGGQYAAIDMESNPPKLVARRWFKQEMSSTTSRIWHKGSGCEY